MTATDTTEARSAGSTPAPPVPPAPPAPAAPGRIAIRLLLAALFLLQAYVRINLREERQEEQERLRQEPAVLIDAQRTVEEASCQAEAASAGVVNLAERLEACTEMFDPAG